MASHLSTRLTLGQFTFKDFEYPESIQFGGSQRLSVKRLVGGSKVVDAMGFDPENPSWGGIFLGKDAMNRAMQLKSMSQTGQEYLLQFDRIAYIVVILSFLPLFQRPYYVPYSIVCEVTQDMSQYAGSTTVSVNDSILTDAGDADTLCGLLGDSPLSSTMSSLTGAIKSVSDFAKASQSTLNSVLAPLAQVQSRVNVLIKSVDGTLANVTTVGGLLPNNPVSKLASQLSNYVGAAQSSPILQRLNSVLGRMGTNIGQINSSVRTVTVPGGNLFDIASKHYGDAMGWTAIAAANPSLKGETQLSGVTTLVIPSYVNKSDGVTS